MQCTQCGTDFEGNFCPSCGHPASEAAAGQELCSRCGTLFAGRFCPNCGWAAGLPFPLPRSSVGRTLLGVAWTGSVLVYLVFLALLLAAFLYVSPAIFEGIVGGQCQDCVAFLFFVNPLAVFGGFLFLILLIGGGLGFLTYFLLQLAFLLFLFGWLIYRDARPTIAAFRQPLAAVGKKARSGSAFLRVGQLFMAILLFDTIYFSIILPLLGIDATVPPGLSEVPPWYLAYQLVDAAIWEEVAVRLVFIGLPMALGSLLLRVTRAAARSPLEGPSPPGMLLGSLKYLVGGQVTGASPRRVQMIGALLVFLSAVLFGYLHVVSWEAWWKFVDTFIGGLALGYLFLRKGLLAGILLHFSINASSVLLYAAGGEESLGALALLGVFTLVLLVAGVGYAIFYLWEGGRFLWGLKPRPPRKAVPAKWAVTQPPQSHPAAYPVTCANCGAQEAIYADGTFTCARCGHRL